METVVFHGQEKSETNSKLARMNLAVHGLDASNIKQGNTFYDQIEHLVGQCDFVMANPPFNVDGVETKKVEKQVGDDGRLPFGLPGLNGKTGAISNANSLWIQYFYSYLNSTGRAGFVMASSASDAGNKDRDIREKLVKSGHMDVMVAIGNKFFYTRTLPCTLWFFDKGKPQQRQDTVLMLDARSVYHVVSARSHVFTEEQLANLNAIVWLYRGESEKFTALVAKYQQQAAQWLAELPDRIAADTAVVDTIAQKLTVFAEGATLDELNQDQPEDAKLDEGALEAFKGDVSATQVDVTTTESIAALLKAAEEARAVIGKVDAANVESLKAIQATLEELAPQLRSIGKLFEARHKTWLKLLEAAEKGLRARLSKTFEAKALREARRALQAADVKKSEDASTRDLVLEGVKQSAHFIAQGHWLLSRFPGGVFTPVPGLCKAVTVEAIAGNDYSLTPGQYVGVAAVSEDDEEDFAEKMRAIHDELTALSETAAELGVDISRNFEELFA